MTSLEDQIIAAHRAGVRDGITLAADYCHRCATRTDPTVDPQLEAILHQAAAFMRDELRLRAHDCFGEEA